MVDTIEVIILILFIIIGWIYAFKPKIMLGITSWSFDKFWGAKFIPTKRTESLYRTAGIILLLFALFVILIEIFVN